MDHKQFESSIAARIRQIREDGSSGNERERLARAMAEIEREWSLPLHGETSRLVPPKITISQRPIRHHA